MGHAAYHQLGGDSRNSTDFLVPLITDALEKKIEASNRLAIGLAGKVRHYDPWPDTSTNRAWPKSGGPYQYVWMISFEQPDRSTHNITVTYIPIPEEFLDCLGTMSKQIAEKTRQGWLSSQPDIDLKKGLFKTSRIIRKDKGSILTNEYPVILTAVDAHLALRY